MVKTIKGGVKPFNVEKKIFYDKPEVGRIDINSVDGNYNCAANALLLLGVISETNTEFLTFLTENVGVLEENEEGEMEEVEARGMSANGLLLILNRTYKQEHIYTELTNEIMSWLLPGQAALGSYTPTRDGYQAGHIGHAFVVINHNNELYIADSCKDWFGPMHLYFTEMKIPTFWKKQVVRPQSPYPPDIFITKEIILDTIAQRDQRSHMDADDLIRSYIGVPELSRNQRIYREFLVSKCLQTGFLLEEAPQLERAEAAEGGRRKRRERKTKKLKTLHLKIKR